MKVLAASSLRTDLRQMGSALVNVLLGQHRSAKLVASFEREFARFTGAPHCLATSMARTGLFQALSALNVKPGGSILMSPVTIPEMLAVVESQGLSVSFVDFAPRSLFVSIDELVQKIAELRPAAVFITLVAGQFGDLRMIKKSCQNFSVPLILDATQVFGSTYDSLPLTDIADVVIYSTCEFKFVHTLRGGMITTRHTHLNQAISRQLNSVRKFPSTLRVLEKWFFDFLIVLILMPFFLQNLFYFLRNIIFIQDPLAPFDVAAHRFPVTRLRANDYLSMRQRLPDWILRRANSLQARLGLLALKTAKTAIDHHRAVARQFLASTVFSKLVPRQAANCHSSYWRFPIIFSDPKQAQEVCDRLAKIGIILERSGLSVLASTCPVAREVMQNTYFIPNHPGVSLDDSKRILNAFSSLERKTDQRLQIVVS